MQTNYREQEKPYYNTKEMLLLLHIVYTSIGQYYNKAYKPTRSFQLLLQS